MKNVYNRPSSLLDKEITVLLSELYPKYSMVLPGYAKHTVAAADSYYQGTNHEEAVVVECGVHRGGMSVLLAKVFPDKHLYMFDSFQGFEAIGKSPFSNLNLAKKPEGEFENAERHFPGKIWHVGGQDLTDAFTQDKVLENLKDFGLIPSEHGITITPGFVGDTLPEFLKLGKQIACLRIDVDAYAATYECLHYLYDSVVTGGVIIFDDFTVGEAKLAIGNFAQLRGFSLNVIPAQELGCYLIKV